MTARLRVGIVGLGGVGRLHLEAVQTSPRLQLVGGADPVPAQRSWAEARGCPTFVDLETMLAAAAPQIVCIASPASLHEAHVLSAAAAGVPALCEKPLTLGVESARRMIQACERGRVELFYGASYRHLEPLRQARAIIATGAIGDVVLMLERLVGGTGAAAREPALGPLHYPLGGPGGGGMGLVDHGVHLIDSFAWLSGQQVVAAYGRGNIAGDAPAPEFAVLDFGGGAQGHLLYDDGTFPLDLPGEGAFSRGDGFQLAGISVPGQWDPSPGTISVYGTRGSLRILHYAGYLYQSDRDGIREVSVTVRPPAYQFQRQLEVAATDLREGSRHAARGEEGRQALAVIEAIYRSHALGRRVDVTLTG